MAMYRVFPKDARSAPEIFTPPFTQNRKGCRGVWSACYSHYIFYMLCLCLKSCRARTKCSNIREGGDIGLFFTLVSIISFIITFSYLLAYHLWGLLLNFDVWFIKLSVQTFQPLTVMCKMGNFVYHHWVMYINFSAIVLSLKIRLIITCLTAGIANNFAIF